MGFIIKKIYKPKATNIQKLKVYLMKKNKNNGKQHN
jgi:hypothetical protein